MRKDQDRDRDGDPGYANDNGGHKREEAPAQARGALASTVSLEALSASLNSVDTSAYGGRSLAMMLFKREGSGTYVVGSRRWESLGYQPDDFLLGLRRLQQGQ